MSQIEVMSKPKGYHTTTSNYTSSSVGKDVKASYHNSAETRHRDAKGSANSQAPKKSQIAPESDAKAAQKQQDLQVKFQNINN